MKISPKIIILSASTIVFSGLSLSLGYLYLNKKTICTKTSCPSIRSSAEIELQKIKAIEKKPETTPSLKITGWIPDWDFTDGFESFKNQASSFDSISPFWFTLQNNGTLKPNRSTNNQELITFTTQKDINLIPTITCFDANTLSEVLSNKDAIDQHINTIMSMITTHQYQGIDLDYESIYLSDKDNFYYFLKTLSAKLKENHKLLVFTVVSKWGDESVLYTTLPQTRRTFEYDKIAQYADELRIMTYDYTSRSSKYYGPVAPITWMEDVIRYAVYIGVPRNKIVLGIPTYAFDWTERPAMPQIEYYPVLNNITTEDLKEGVAYYRDEIEKVKDAYNFNVTFNNEWAEAVGTYINTRDENRIVVFPTQQSIDLRKNLAAEYGIKGVTYWRIGDEAGLKY